MNRKIYVTANDSIRQSFRLHSMPLSRKQQAPTHKENKTILPTKTSKTLKNSSSNSTNTKDTFGLLNSSDSDIDTATDGDDLKLYFLSSESDTNENDPDTHANDCDTSENDSLKEFESDFSAHEADVENINSRTKLARWVCVSKCPATHVNSLLKILRDTYDHSLPKDCRTLCKTPKKSEVREFSSDDGSTYFYTGIKRALTIFFNSQENLIENLVLDFNVDGVGVSNSSPSQIWPILMSIVGFDKVYLIGCHHGEKKPNNANEFLKDFVSEMREDITKWIFDERIGI